MEPYRDYDKLQHYRTLRRRRLINAMCSAIYEEAIRRHRLGLITYLPSPETVARYGKVAYDAMVAEEERHGRPSSTSSDPMERTESPPSEGPEGQGTPTEERADAPSKTVRRYDDPER